MYRVFKPKGSFSNVTITNENTTSSVVLGRFSIAHKNILDAAGVSYPSSQDEWSFQLPDEVGKQLAMSCFTGHKPPRFKKDKPTEQKEPEKKKLTAYDYLFGYTDELDDDEDED